MPVQPWKVGWTESSNKFGREQVQPHQLRLSAAATLRDLSDQYAFYTPALLYMIVPLRGQDPFAAFLQEYNKQVLPLSIRFNRPIFQGLDVGPVKDWNYMLFAMEQEHFKHFLPWLLSATFVDREHGLVYRLGEKTVRIADPVFFEKTVILPAELPCIDVTVICIDGSAGCCYLEAGSDTLLDRPKLAFAEPFDDTRKLAKALITQQARPFDVIEKDTEQDMIDRVTEARKKLEEE